MKKIKLITVVMFLLIASASFGQLSFGEKTGLNLSNLAVDGNSDNKSKIGLDIGFYAEYSLNDQFSIQLPLMYSTKGTKQKSGGVTERTALSYIELQPNLIYKKTVKNNAFYGSIGAYYAPYAFGMMKANKKIYGLNDNSSKTENIKMGSNANDVIKSTDFGLNLALGIEMKKEVRVGIQYELGLTNILNLTNSSVKNRSISIYFTTPFAFGKKNNKK